MTANDTNRVGGHNSVSLLIEGAEQNPGHDTRCRRIVEQAKERGGTTTRADALAETGPTTDELDELLPVLAAAGYVDVIGDGAREPIQLTCRGDVVAGGI